MITVYTGCWGGRYDSGYIGRMFRMVSRHMEQPFRFKCITETRRPGWWGKVEILENPGPALWIDIDTVVTGQLDDLCITNADIRVAKNWAQSGHGGCQSSVMYWNDARHIAEMFDEAHVCWPPSNDGRLWGDSPRSCCVKRSNFRQLRQGQLYADLCSYRKERLRWTDLTRAHPGLVRTHAVFLFPTPIRMRSKALSVRSS